MVGWGCLRGASAPLRKIFPLSFGRGVRKVKPLCALLLLASYSSNLPTKPDEREASSEGFTASILPPMISLLVLVDKKASFLLLENAPPRIS